MTAEDTYKTITEPSEGIYTEKRSKFIAIALPVRTIDEIKVHLETYQKKYYDARHVCYAYMLGAARKDFRANDNGEPSGTAGKPILGQINSNEQTDILESMERKRNTKKLGELLYTRLDPREREIICMRYGILTSGKADQGGSFPVQIGCGEEATQREIGALLGISRSYVSRIEKRALQKLRMEFEQG